MLPVNGFGNLEYREFLKKFSGEQQGLEKVAKSLPRSTLERPTSLRRPKTAPCALKRSAVHLLHLSTPLLNCEDVEMKVRPRIQDCWRHIQRRCRPADPERTGEIDVDMFLSTFLSPLEFEQLAVKYDIKNSGHLSYPDFLRHFVLMFSPQVNSASHRLKLQLPRTPVSSLSLELLPAVVLNRPMRKVQYSVNLSEEEFFHFTFFDKNLSGRISYNDFLCIFLK
uniref:EF-hand domain-containing protein n=1 Tax=Sinocyclocheilus anshuiensis TaxID=1608454 RepID=A0A671PII2_9TELE